MEVIIHDFLYFIFSITPIIAINNLLSVPGFYIGYNIIFLLDRLSAQK